MHLCIVIWVFCGVKMEWAFGVQIVRYNVIIHLLWCMGNKNEKKDTICKYNKGISERIKLWMDIMQFKRCSKELRKKAFTYNNCYIKEEAFVLIIMFLFKMRKSK